MAPPRSVTVRSAAYRAVLDNRGAVLSSWVLGDYKSAKGDPFEMIPASRESGGRSLPGALLFEDEALTALANGEHYEVEVNGPESPEGGFAAPVEVVMRLQRGDLSIRKSFRFLEKNYLVELEADFEQDGRPVPAKILLAQDIGPETEHFLNPAILLSAVSNIAGKVQRDQPPDQEGEIGKVGGDVRWIGLEMQYFTIIAIPLKPVSVFEMTRMPVTGVGLDGSEIKRDLVLVTIPENGAAQYHFYLGPKLQSALESVTQGDLSGVIDYGFFSILVRPLLWGLMWINGYIHNYGTSIVLLTLILTLALFPFRLKQMVSMKGMQVVQPKVKEIQERYKKYKKTDPRRAQMNQEVMAIYKEHGVNPLGGCLPLILQMPILFAFYSLLASSIELRQAPFMGWIQDLSAKDPYYVLPIVMGITMLISTKMAPMTPGADPTQAKIMMIMPVVFTVMFLNVSSGLNLYFLCSNIFSVAFQKVAERWIGDTKQAKPKSRK